MSSNQELNGDNYEAHVWASIKQIEETFNATLDSVAPRGEHYVAKFRDKKGKITHWATIHTKMARVLLKNMG